MAMSQSTVLRLYNTVMEDVITGVRETFLDDGVDEQVLQELRQLWESKLLASKAVEQALDPPDHPPPPVITNNLKANGAIKTYNRYEPNSTTQSSSAQQVNSTTGSATQQSGSGTSSTTTTTNLANLDPNSKVPVQLTLPAQAGVAGSAQRVFTLQIPASALNNNQLHQILTGPVITATMNLPQNMAATLLQQHINAALLGQQSNFTTLTTTASTVSRSQLDGGGYDSSDDSDGGVGGGGSDNDDDAGGSGIGSDGLDDEDAEDGDDGGPEEEPLNSGDDVSEEDPSDMFDTDNVVVCQYDKITRSRNKWKFHLKDGIMNLSGKDFVFQKANGDAEW